MKVALVYDRVNKWGGAERVLLALKELFPDAPLFTSVYNPRSAPWADTFRIKTSFLQHFPYASRTHEMYALLMPLAFESFTFDAYDLVISVTSEAAKGVITKPTTHHICYSLTPTRYLWSSFYDYFRNPFTKLLGKIPVSYLRAWDKMASTRPDAYIAISREVQKRIASYYAADSELVYPPFSFEQTNKKLVKKTEDYFLVVSRLVPYKRIDIAISACNELGIPLKIVGTGSEMRRLRRLAGKNVTFLGSLTDSELMGYYSGCKALLFPGIEDFGITPVEAQSFGKPVIAYKGGGVLETVIDRKTGLLFTPQTKNGLVEAIKTFETMEFNQQACKRQAEKFGKEIFKKEFLRTIDKIVEKLH